MPDPARSSVVRPFRGPAPASERIFSSEGDNPRLGAILSVDAAELASTIGLACVCGWAIMFSPTSDGGALGVHVWSGSSREKKYATSQAELESLLARVRDAAEAKLAGTPGASLKLAR